MPRARKSAAQHQLEGTYRESRHGEAELDLPAPMDALAPSDRLPASVVDEWRSTTRQLVSIGILIEADVPLLESAFVLLADARYYHELIVSVQKRGVLDEDDIAQLLTLNGMHIKALALYTTIISRFGISPSERAKILHALPKKKDEGKKKSVRDVLAGGKNKVAPNSAAKGRA